MPSIPRPRILYVDDHEDSRDMLSIILQLERIDAKAVATAAEALSSVQAERFDLYLLDTNLPDLDGFQLCRKMRESDQKTPILFFSGHAYETDKQKGFEAGANAYLSKPDIEGLIGSITQFVFPLHSSVAA